VADQQLLLHSRSALLQSDAHFALLQLVRHSPASVVHCALHLPLSAANTSLAGASLGAALDRGGASAADSDAIIVFDVELAAPPPPASEPVPALLWRA
jgi:hypothetical protein